MVTKPWAKVGALRVVAALAGTGALGAARLAAGEGLELAEPTPAEGAVAATEPVEAAELALPDVAAAGAVAVAWLAEPDWAASDAGAPPQATSVSVSTAVAPRAALLMPKLSHHAATMGV